MSTLPRHQELHVTSAEESISTKLSSSEKLQLSLQEQENPGIYQSQYLPAKHVRMLIQNSFLEKFNPWTKYDGLHIYDMEDDE
jgi:hypothetical protein